MSILLDALPEKVKIGDLEIGIHTDFRVSIQFELLMQNEALGKEEKILKALQLYYGSSWKSLPGECGEEAVNQMIWFYRCGKEERAARGKISNEVVYSYEHDDQYIYASFLDQYGVDLQKVDFLHWWQFKAMFDALSDDRKIMEIIKIRAMKLDGKMSSEQKKHYRELKRLYALPKSKKSEEEKELERILLEGGDIRTLEVANGEDQM